MVLDDRPLTRYAKSPDEVSVAYQVTGDGPLDLVLPPTNATPIDLGWDAPSFVRFARRLRGFSRTVKCEARGIGASGGTFQDRFDDEIVDADLTAVLDAVGCDRVALVGFSDGGPVVIRYAVTHPERVTALVLINTYAHNVREDDYPWGVPRDLLDRFAASTRSMPGATCRY